MANTRARRESGRDYGAAFVAGATGYTGREVVRLLVERGIQTVAHVRPDSPRLDEWRERFRRLGAKVDATPWEEPAMTATLSRLGPAHVFALLGTTRARMRSERRAGRDPKAAGYEAVDYGLTALLIRAAAASGNRPRFVYLSATGVGPGSANAYYQARWKAETDLQKSGLPYTIARPSFIVGPARDDERPFELLGARLIDTALFAASLLGFRRLNQRYRSTTNSTLASALIRLALDPNAANAIFESEALRS